jgi:hypothetical protein
MRKIIRICVISLSIIFLVLGVKFNKAYAQQWENIPQHIRQLVFEQSRFSLPITFQLPCSDDPSTKERILEEWRKPTQSSFPPRGPQNAGLIDESFLHFLIENKFAKVDKFVMGRGTKYMREYKILSYSDTIKPYIVKGDFENNNFHIILAARTLKSIDYTNEYEATPAGFKIKFFALTFTYTLSDIFPNLPKTTKQFRGEARAFLDLDDGKWKIDKYSLEDQDSTEYMTLLRAQYDIFVRKQQERFIASGLSFRYGDNNVLFSFQFEGGKPPYKYGKLTLNGKTYEEVFGSYIEAKQSTIVTFMTERNTLYQIDFHQLEKGGGGFTIFISKNWPFGWSPDISFPLRVGITIFDSASPPKSAYLDTIVNSGTMLSATEKLLPPVGLHFAEEKLRVWIEKYGKKLETKDTPKIEPSLQMVKLLSPQNSSTLPPGDTPFSWNPVSNATKYEFILYNSRGQVALDTTINRTSITVALGIEETINWEVRAGDNGGNWGAWSSLWSLTVNSTTTIIKDSMASKTYEAIEAKEEASVKDKTIYKIGDRVQANDYLNVREQPSMIGKIVTVIKKGEIGIIKNNYTIANGYRWWIVKWDSGPQGWSAGEYLVK